MEAPRRKHPRLKEHDYSQNGAYFVTFCTKDKQCILSSVGRGALAPPPVTLSALGEIAERFICSIPVVYSSVRLDHYVIMPNHVHLLLRIDSEDGGARAPRPTVMTIVGGIKSLTAREAGSTVWQTSFHDHVIRDRADYLRIWSYIDTNPAKWAEDCYYTEDTPCNTNGWMNIC